MEGKNVILAFVLSSMVLIGWAVFFEPPVVEQNTVEEKISKNQDIESPSIDEDKKDITSEISRKHMENLFELLNENSIELSIAVYPWPGTLKNDQVSILKN